MKLPNKALEHIEIVSSGDTALFEIRLVVAMTDWSDDEADAGLDEMSALGWLLNLLQLASQGEDIQTGAQEFLKSMMTLNEERVYLAKIERIEIKEEDSK